MASVALIEIADVFGTLPAMIDRVTDRDIALSKLVSAYGVRFAGTGDPKAAADRQGLFAGQSSDYLMGENHVPDCRFLRKMPVFLCRFLPSL